VTELGEPVDGLGRQVEGDVLRVQPPSGLLEQQLGDPAQLLVLEPS
jgi:hypothetical protein